MAQWERSIRDFGEGFVRVHATRVNQWGCQETLVWYEQDGVPLALCAANYIRRSGYRLVRVESSVLRAARQLRWERRLTAERAKHNHAN
jgi:hypothetical protein